MKISGFTFIKNGDTLYIPLRESILSILPICDEFIIAVGDNSPGDRTEEIIQSIDSEKIKVIRTIWDTKAFPKNTEFARQTDIAKSHCSGDWLFYLQCDEAIHENDLSKIKAACENYLNDESVDGLLFNYLHFWGDYNHYHKNHAWYQKEIRVIRNLPNIHSWRDAQSFRKFTEWSGTYEDYQKKEGSEKLCVKWIKDVYVYHYGYVRPPDIMSGKIKIQSESYRGEEATKEHLKYLPPSFDYGPLRLLTKFTGTHPATMSEWMAKHNWSNQLNFGGKSNPNRPKHKHEKLKYRIVTWVENSLLRGRTIGGFKNYIEI
jgi:glycosyltransferase involved in cell wall biosynthesis